MRGSKVDWCLNPNEVTQSLPLASALVYLVPRHCFVVFEEYRAGESRMSSAQDLKGPYDNQYINLD